MAAKKPKTGKKYFTVAEANATLPLVRVIVRDIAELARELRERHERLTRLLAGEGGGLSREHEEELLEVRSEFERGQGRMKEYETELAGLGIELKDYLTGLVDFPAKLNGREVYLCWRMGEPEVGHWHDLDAGFAGRQKIRAGAPSR